MGSDKPSGPIQGKVLTYIQDVPINIYIPLTTLNQILLYNFRNSHKKESLISSRLGVLLICIAVDIFDEFPKVVTSNFQNG